MELLMHMEQENGDLYVHPSKFNQGFNQPSKGLKAKRSFNNAKGQSLRKALGNVNQHVQDKQSSTKVKNNNLVHPKSKKTYPDIETFIPYNPLDFETFDVPEEHKLSDRCLAGVPLFISLHNAKRFETLTSPILSPMDIGLINYDSHETFSPMFEDLTIDLPLACDF
ncbi:securin-like [Rhinoderma darwinii]|uniref:securin-like n=1 Tax=Rhinoderma darwinii TaxID=43563 RepID=UPI003F67AFA7